MPRSRKIVKLLLITVTVFYLVFHAFTGEQGLYAFVVELHKRDHLEQELAEVKSERESLEKKVAMMRSESLDPDLLDEQARRLLGVAKPDELVVITK